MCGPMAKVVETWSRKIIFTCWYWVFEHISWFAGVLKIPKVVHVWFDCKLFSCLPGENCYGNLETVANFKFVISAVKHSP